MKISSRLYVNALLSLLLFITILITILILNNQVETNFKIGEINETIHRTISELNVLTYEYLIYEEERIKNQWYQKYTQIQSYIKKNHDVVRLTSFLTKYQQLENNFTLLVNLRHKQKNAADKQISIEQIKLNDELHDRLIARLLITNQAIITDISRHVEVINNRTKQKIQTTNHFTLMIILIFVIINIIISLYIIKGISRPLSTLIESSVIIGEGDLDYTIPILTNDELGNLAQSFNEMISKLKVVTASRDELNKEKMEREKSESNYKILFDSMAQGVLYRDKNGKIISVNKATQTITGLSQSQLLGIKLMPPGWKIVHEDGSEFLENDYPAFIALKTGKPIYNVIIGFYPSNEEKCRWVKISAIPQFKDNEKQPFQVFSTVDEITRIKESEKDLIKARDDAQIANRAKTEFLANMSHEIRTPLNAVIGFSELLSSKVTDQKSSKYIASINSAGKSLLTLINDILDLSKIEANKIELSYAPLDLKKLCHEITSIFKKNIEDKNLNFTVHYTCNQNYYFYLDEVRIRQVLLNLLGNAVKFTDTGSIDFTVRCNDFDPEILSTTLVLEIKDTGIGIKEKNLDQIFMAFKQQDGQSNRKYGGTGLGLAICKKLINIMGGTISVSSREGRGAIFCITLPQVKLHESHDTTLYDDTLFRMSYYFEQADILIADDNESNRELLKEALTRVGLSVREAKNGLEALQLSYEKKPACIIMDIKMPEMNGNEATMKIRFDDSLKDIPVIGLTASTYINNIDYSDYFNTILYKPVNLYALYDELSKYIECTVNEASQIEPNKKEAVAFNLSIHDKSQISKVIIPRIKEMKSVIVFKDVKELASTLKKQGEMLNNAALIDFAGLLTANLSTFDINEVKELLKHLETILT